VTETLEVRIKVLQPHGHLYGVDVLVNGELAWSGTVRKSPKTRWPEMLRAVADQGGR
jgi:hypothetical protein